MKILLLTHAFNSLAQGLHVALRDAGHEVSVELDIADSVTEEAVAGFRPDVVVAPFMKRRIPATVWRQFPSLVVHPGPPGDRGPSALDWALLDGETRWGVTVLQATDDYDAGPVWAWRAFDVPAGITKASLYRRAVVPAATAAVLEALGRIGQGGGQVPPQPTGGADQAPHAGWRPLVAKAQRQVDFGCHPTAEIVRRVRSADGSPGAAAHLFGTPCRLFDVHEATPEEAAQAAAAMPGQGVARREPAVLVRTVDGALWVGHVRLEDRTALLPPEQGGARPPTEATDGPAAANGAVAARPSASLLGLKLPTTRALAGACAGLPEWPVALDRSNGAWDELQYREQGPHGARVGWLDFEFHNGALSERQARRLIQALAFADARPTRVLVLAGGRDFFSNGIHLHEIEAAAADANAARADGLGIADAQGSDSPADASWRSIQAIDDVALALLQMTGRLTVSALRGNAGAGGCFLALAADAVWAREGIVQNPHYKNMGNLYGSEYWTYLLPRRVGAQQAQRLMRSRLPMGTREALALGLLDAAFGSDLPSFEAEVLERASALAASEGWQAAVDAKQARRAADEATKPLATYRDEELACMRRNFYGFDPSYHVARHHFVHRKPHAWTPRHLALHR